MNINLKLDMTMIILEEALNKAFKEYNIKIDLVNNDLMYIKMNSFGSYTCCRRDSKCTHEGVIISVKNITEILNDTTKAPRVHNPWSLNGLVALNNQ
jgi:hypothetical protein